MIRWWRRHNRSRPARFRTEWSAGVGDDAAFPVLPRPLDGLPASTLTLDGGRRLAELAQARGPLKPDRSARRPGRAKPAPAPVSAQHGAVVFPPAGQQCRPGPAARARLTTLVRDRSARTADRGYFASYATPGRTPPARVPQPGLTRWQGIGDRRPYGLRCNRVICVGAGVHVASRSGRSGDGLLPSCRWPGVPDNTEGSLPVTAEGSRNYLVAGAVITSAGPDAPQEADGPPASGLSALLPCRPAARA